MARFTFLKGQWVDGSDLPEWADGEDLGAYLVRVGFASRVSVGSEHGSEIELYERSSGDDFFALVTPTGAAGHEVYIPDFPSLMLFMKDYASAFSAVHARDDQREILELLEKIFRVYHRHEPHELCKECDPNGWAAHQKWLSTRGKLGGQPS